MMDHKTMSDGQKITDLLNKVVPLFETVLKMQNEIGGGNPIGPVFIQPDCKSILGYGFYVRRIPDGGTEPDWVPYAIARAFDTGHVAYIMGSLDLTKVQSHDPKQTIRFLQWLKDQMRECLPKVERPVS